MANSLPFFSRLSAFPRSLFQSGSVSEETSPPPLLVDSAYLRCEARIEEEMRAADTSLFDSHSRAIQRAAGQPSARRATPRSCTCICVPCRAVQWRGAASASARAPASGIPVPLAASRRLRCRCVPSRDYELHERSVRLERCS